MHPRLIALDGPMKGTSIELAEDEVAIGRSPASRFPIRDLSVSRQHCVIRRQGETFTIHDLGSTQGTFLNGVPVTEHSLSHGDQVTIGDSVFLFTLGEDQAPPGPGIAEI